jgi:transcriptional regulator with XRE-family HTH domain
MSKIKFYQSDAIDNILKEIDPEVEKRIEFRMQLATRIDKARMKMNLSKKQFAAKLSKSPSEISKWLSGTHNFTSDTLFEIQQLLKVELINVEDRPMEEIWHFSVQVAQEELRSSIIPGFTRQNAFSDLFYKSTASKLSESELYNYKIVAEA